MSNSIVLTDVTAEHGESVYHLICELRQDKALDIEKVKQGLQAGIHDANIYYQLAWLDNEPVGFISMQRQFHLHHARWIGEVQELVVLAKARGYGVGKTLLAWAEAQARHIEAELTELSTSTHRLDAHRFYTREGYRPTHLRFTKALASKDSPAKDGSHK